jgi:hypothetical protein
MAKSPTEVGTLSTCCRTPEDDSSSLNSDHVGEVLAGFGEPPIAKEKTDNRKGGKVGEAGPVGGGAFDQDAAIAANQGRKGIDVDVQTIPLGDD